MKNGIFWDVTPSRSCKNQSFVGLYCLHQGEKNQRAGNNVNVNWLLLMLFVALVDSFHPDDGGNTLLSNVVSYNSHTVSIPEHGILQSHHRENLLHNFSYGRAVVDFRSTVNARIYLLFFTFTCHILLMWFLVRENSSSLSAH
jgi:hypothetical protein